MRRLVALSAWLATIACSGQPARTRAADRATGSPPLASDAGAAEAPDRDPRLDALLEERDRLLDRQGTVYLAPAPSTPVPARARLPPRSGPFPRAAGTTVRAYLVLDPIDEPDSPGALRMPFTAGGRLDDGVVLPEAELTGDEVADLEALVAARHDSGIRLRCDFEAHHVFVFFDAGGAPRAKLFVCMTCGEWIAAPAIANEAAPMVMTGQERSVLRRVLDAHGLGPWIFDDDDATHREVRAYEERLYGTRDAPTAAGRQREQRIRSRASGVDPDLSSARATRHDRRLVCTWFFDQVWRRSGRRGDAGYRCDSGPAYTLGGECDAPFACDAPMGRIEACMRRFADGPERICASGPGPECAGLRGCVPGVRWVTGAWK